MRTTTGAVLLAAALVGAGCGTTGEEIGTRIGPLGMGDENVAATVYTANLGALEAALLATERGADEKVCDYARRTAWDHVEADAELRALLEREDLVLDARGVAGELVRENRDMVSVLRHHQAAFDHVFLDRDIAMHERLVDMIDRLLVPAARDDDLEAELMRLRTLEQGHLRQAQALRGS